MEPPIENADQTQGSQESPEQPARGSERRPVLILAALVAGLALLFVIAIIVSPPGNAANSPIIFITSTPGAPAKRSVGIAAVAMTATLPPSRTPRPSRTPLPGNALAVPPSSASTPTELAVSPTAIPTPFPATPAARVQAPAVMPGYNLQCKQTDAAQICASVSVTAPAQSTYVVVYGRLLINGKGQAGQAMQAAWAYKSSSPSCSGTTNAKGQATCSRGIGHASRGFPVVITVTIGGYSVNTSFTPN